jgi:hypothetical protein
LCPYRRFEVRAGIEAAEKAPAVVLRDAQGFQPRELFSKYSAFSRRAFLHCLGEQHTARLKATSRATQLILLPLSTTSFFFCRFRPKIACQASKPPKSLKQSKIDLAF